MYTACMQNGLLHGKCAKGICDLFIVTLFCLQFSKWARSFHSFATHLDEQAVEICEEGRDGQECTKKNDTPSFHPPPYKPTFFAFEYSVPLNYGSAMGKGCNETRQRLGVQVTLLVRLKTKAAWPIMMTPNIVTCFFNSMHPPLRHGLLSLFKSPPISAARYHLDERFFSLFFCFGSWVIFAKYNRGI